MGILLALLSGLLVGLIAKWFMPKRMEEYFSFWQILGIGLGGGVVASVVSFVLGLGGGSGFIGGILGACFLIWAIYKYNTFEPPK